MVIASIPDTRHVLRTYHGYIYLHGKNILVHIDNHRWKDMNERDKRRLEELRKKDEEGFLSTTERIELELLEDQEDLEDGEDGPFLDEEEEEEREDSEYEKFKSYILRKDAESPEEIEQRVMEEVEEFELVPVEGEKADGTLEQVATKEDREEVAEDKGPAVIRKVDTKWPEGKGPKGDADPEKVKMAIAFGAGALAGYLLKDFLDDKDNKIRLLEADDSED
jgi:hypothetical protein